MSDLISREEVIKRIESRNERLMHDEEYRKKRGDIDLLGVIPSIHNIPSADIMECARAMKEYCEKHRNEHNFYMCGTCEYSSSEYSSFLHEKPFKCPFNVPAYWDLPEPHRTESGEV